VSNRSDRSWIRSGFFSVSASIAIAWSNLNPEIIRKKLRQHFKALYAAALWRTLPPRLPHEINKIIFIDLFYQIVLFFLIFQKFHQLSFGRDRLTAMQQILFV
jgi:hypothetical protein